MGALVSTLYRSVDHGLRTAFAFPHFSDAGRGARAGRLSHAEASAQARMVRDFVQRLPGAGAHYVMAFYGIGREKETATRLLLALPAVQACFPPSNAAGELLLRRYFSNGDGTRTLRDIAAELGVSHTTVMRAENSLKAKLSQLFATAEAAVFDYFERNSLAPPTVS